MRLRAAMARNAKALEALEQSVFTCNDFPLSLGYVSKQRLSAFYGDGEDALLMERHNASAQRSQLSDKISIKPSKDS